MKVADAAPTVFLARQPIYDRRLNVYAYELLYRRAGETQAGEVGPAESAETITRAIVEIGLDALVGNKPAFINIPPCLLSDPCVELLPQDRVVLEILETTQPTGEHLDSVARLAAKGYRIALDDYVFNSPQTEFIPWCKIVKVDLRSNDRHTLAAGVEALKKTRVRVLAEKVETMQMYARCQASGFDYYQGYFFARPDIVVGRGIPPQRTMLIQILQRLQDPKIALVEIEKLVISDVALTYRLLKLVNSACLSPGEHVDSVRATLMILGLERVVALVSLLAMAGVAGKSSELMITAMVRAKMCEGVAQALRYDNVERHFTVGLLSVLEAMFDTPMEELMTQIPLAPDLKAALVDNDSNSELATSLRLTLTFEEGRWEELRPFCTAAKEISDSYVHAIRWADSAKFGLAA